MRYESPRRWLLGPASTDGDGLGHSPAWLIGPSGATLGRRPDYSITSSARPSSDSGKVRPNASPSNRGDPNKNCPRFTRPRAELFCYLLPMICSCVSCSGVVPIRRASPNRPHAVTQAKSALPPKADIRSAPWASVLCQASAQHFQQCAEFPLLRNRGLGPLAVTVLSSSGKAAA